MLPLIYADDSQEKPGFHALKKGNNHKPKILALSATPVFSSPTATPRHTPKMEAFQFSLIALSRSPFTYFGMWWDGLVCLTNT